MAAKKSYTVQAPNGLNVRKFPTKNAPIVRVLLNGEKVGIDGKTETPGGWAAIIGGGYVMSEYLK